MVSLVGKIGNEAGWTAFEGAVGGAAGYGFGYVYAKLSDLPAGQAGKAYAVASAVYCALSYVVITMTEGVKHARYIRCGVRVLVQSAYTFEMRRRGWMGDKLLIANFILLAFHIWCFVRDE